MKEATRELMSNQGINPNIIFNRSHFDKKEKKREEMKKARRNIDIQQAINLI